MDREAQVRALGSEARILILRLLADPQKYFGHQKSADPVSLGVCMTLIAEALAVSQPTASRHIDILRQARLITVDRHQKWSYCKRDEAGIQDYFDWIRRELNDENGTAAFDRQ